MDLFEKTLESKEIFDGKVIHVTLDKVELQDGKLLFVRLSDTQEEFVLLLSLKTMSYFL